MRVLSSYWAVLCCLVLLTALLFPVQGFFSNHAGALHASVAENSSTHAMIIDRALRRAAKLLMDDYPIKYPDQDKIMATDAFRNALKTFQVGAAKPDKSPQAIDPTFHFDDENITESNDNMLKQREEVLSMIATGEWVGARDQSGMLLGTLHDFYSHSNWVEIQDKKGENNIHSALADPEQKTNLGTIAGPGDTTCTDCVNIEYGTCENNIVDAILDGGILTSGYFHVIGPAPAFKLPGKCSHGSAFDNTKTFSATGGINKDTSFDMYSPHHAHHHQAADLAEDATVAFFNGIRCVRSDEEYAKYLGLESGSASLCFLIDITGSMGGEIAAVRQTTVSITQAAAANPAIAPSQYILVPFSDPISAFGPITQTTDPAVMVAALNALTASGGGDTPEYYFTGLNMALERVLPGSTCYAFTDAHALDENVVPTSLALIATKNVKIVTFLTEGSWNSGYVSYQDVAQTSGGQLIQTTKDELDETLKIIEAGLSANKVTVVLKESVSAGGTQIHDVPVDQTMTELVISITTDYGSTIGSVEIYDNLGALQVPGAPGSGATVIVEADVASVKLYTVAAPATGDWEVRVIGGSGSYNIKVTATSLLDFTYDFVVSMGGAHFAYEPVMGNPTEASGVCAIVVVNVINDDAPANGVDSPPDLVLVSEDGTELKRQTMTALPPSGQFDTCVVLPTSAFRVVLDGDDSSSNVIQRWDTHLIASSEIRLELVLNAEGRFLMKPGETIQVDMKVRNHGDASEVIVLAVRDSKDYFDSISPTSVTVAAGSSSTAQMTFTAPASATPGQSSIVSVSAASGSDNNYAVFRITIESDVVAPEDPVCTITNVDGNCLDVTAGSETCDNVNWSFDVSAQNTDDLGLYIVKPCLYNPDATFTLDPMTPGTNAAVDGSHEVDCCQTKVDIVASDILGNVGRCVVEPEDSDLCTVSQSGALNYLTTNLQLPNNFKSVVAQTGLDTDPCKIKIQIRMDDNIVTFAGFNMAPWPTKPHKYYKNYAFTLWDSPGLTERGYQVPGVVNHSVAPPPFILGPAKVVIDQYNSQSWKLEAFCNDVSEMVLYYNGGADPVFSLLVSQPGDWTGLCYD